MLRRCLLSFLAGLWSIIALAQIDTRHVLNIGKNALYYNDYVLAIRYFNQVVEAKPYLWEPFYYRAIAKYSLEDYQGAIGDCDTALLRNPFVPELYRLRGINRIRVMDMKGAIEDYTQAIDYDPNDQNSLYNRTLCYIEVKEYDRAKEDVNILLARWPKMEKASLILAQIQLQQKDTTASVQTLQKILTTLPYQREALTQLGYIALAQGQYDKAITWLTKAIYEDNKNPRLYINRALAQYKNNKLQAALDDYDKAVSIAPRNYLAHYNRGLLRAQVGDDNRAIEDFNFVLSLAPDNLLTVYNRAILLDKTGDYRAAERDYSQVIEAFPNFWYAIQARARLRRILGDHKGAAADETKLIVQNVNAIYGRNKTKRPIRKLRKWQDNDIDKYNDMVDATSDTIEYATEYRGQVQDKHVARTYRTYIATYLYQHSTAIIDESYFVPEVDKLNAKHLTKRIIALGELGIANSNADNIQPLMHDTLSNTSVEQTVDKSFVLLIQNEGAQTGEQMLKNLENLIQRDTTHALIQLQYAVWGLRVTRAQGTDKTYLKLAEPYLKALQKVTQESSYLRPYAYYNLGTWYAQTGQNKQAVSLLDKAIALQPKLAQAYYNRGILALAMHDDKAAQQDLSKAGELGLYTAYNLLKQLRTATSKVATQE